MVSPNQAIFCDNIGNTTNDLHCCHIDDQNSSIYYRNFGPDDPHLTFSVGCGGGDCITNCQKTAILYSSDSQNDPYVGNGMAPIQRFLTCANVPAMAGYTTQGLLQANISSVVEPHLYPGVSAQNLSGITAAVTDCLTQTCRASRNKKACTSSCSAVDLLINNTAPNIEGLNSCLNTLCTGGYDSLPFADADVIGIGVFASYIMQNMLIVLIWFGLLFFSLYSRYRSKHPRNTKPTEHERRDEKPAEKPVRWDPSDPSQDGISKSKHQELFEDFLVQFHKAQCYFSATIQIASLSYGIFETDMLVTFLLTPLATNGVLPVVFSYVLLFRHGRSSMDVTFLTVACWILSSIVYWILYAHVIPINQDIHSEKRRYRAYQQFMYKLSALDACGGYSALAVCPENFVLGREDITSASHRLRVLTPIIWTFSTVCLIAVLVGKFIKYRRGRRHSRLPSNAEGVEDEQSPAHEHGHPPFFRSRIGAEATYVLVTVCFLAGVGMQLSLLSIGTSLNMMNRMHWSFGQIVAVTIWAEPLLGWMYDESKVLLKSKFNIGNIPK